MEKNKKGPVQNNPNEINK